MTNGKLKTIWWAMVVLAVALLLPGFGSPLKNKPQDDPFFQAKVVYEENAKPIERVPVPPLRGLPAEAAAYTEQISRYFLPLTEGWDGAFCYAQGLSEALPLYAGEDPMESIGFACPDLNGDGVKELVIGVRDADSPRILELWAMVNDKPKLIVQARTDSHYVLRTGAENGGVFLENQTGAAGEETAYFYFTFNGSYLDYFWDFIPGVIESEDEIRSSQAGEIGEPILPDYTMYARLTQK